MKNRKSWNATLYPSIVSFRLSEDDKKKILDICIKQELTMSEYFRMITKQIKPNQRIKINENTNSL